MNVAETDALASKAVAETKSGQDTTYGSGDKAANEEEKQEEQADYKSTDAASGESKKNSIHLDVGSLSRWGWDERHSNEDRCVVESNERFHMFAVIDGHAGSRTANFLVAELFKTLDGVYDNGFDQAKLSKAMDELDSKFCTTIAPEKDRSGACLLAVLLYVDPTTDTPQKIVLNVGDCRAIIREAPEAAAVDDSTLEVAKEEGKDAAESERPAKRMCTATTLLPTASKVVALSEDHSAENIKERSRALLRGAKIWDQRIDGILQPFRAFGDGFLKCGDKKNWVIATPEIHQSKLLVGRSLLVIATDGIWKVLSNNRAMEVAVKELVANGSAQSAATAIADEAARCRALDDMTVIVVSV